jgi:8-oxo-dGTP pyrophosphatase MutT (NUDIX family)
MFRLSRKKKRQKKILEKDKGLKIPDYIDQVSAGGVVFRHCADDKIYVALIRDHNTHNWILPKGRIEEGESLVDTSIREVKEETGLQSIELVDKIGKTNYWFRTKNNPHFTKEVHFYLYKEKKPNEELCVEEENFDKGQWFTKEEAIKKIGFPAQRKILTKAFKIIEKETSSA